MKLSEIYTLLEQIPPQRDDEPIGEYATRYWDSLPRIPYSELPSKIKEQIRETAPPSILYPFIVQCWDAEIVQNVTPEAAEILQDFLNMAGAADTEKFNRLMIRTRNTAKYQIEGSRESGLRANIYGDEIFKAFVNVVCSAFASSDTLPGQIKMDLSVLPQPSSILPVPATTPIYLLTRVLNAGPKGPTQSKRNRHEKIEITVDKSLDIAQYTRKSKNRQQFVSVSHPEDTLKGGGKLLGKLFIFMLQHWQASGFGRLFTFPLQQLVDRNIYSSLDTARVGLDTFMLRQGSIQMGQLKTYTENGQRKSRLDAGFLFYHHSIDNNEVTVYVNEQMPVSVVSEFFTMIPQYAYGLGSNAFFIIYYIMYLARQNGQAMKEHNGRFKITIDSIRQALELPAPENVKGRKYREKIQQPIQNALEEIEIAQSEHMAEMQDFSFTITPSCDESASINEWLNGNWEIELSPKFAEKFIPISERKTDYKKKRKDARIKAEEQEKARAKTEESK